LRQNPRAEKPPTHQRLSPIKRAASAALSAIPAN
jgi:hypothetical protein